MNALVELDNLLNELYNLVNQPNIKDPSQTLMIADLLVSTIREGLTNIAKCRNYEEGMKNRLSELYILTETLDEVINRWKNPAPTRLAIIFDKLRRFKEGICQDANIQEVS